MPVKLNLTKTAQGLLEGITNYPMEDIEKMGDPFLEVFCSGCDAHESQPLDQSRSHITEFTFDGDFPFDHLAWTCNNCGADAEVGAYDQEDES